MSSSILNLFLNGDGKICLHTSFRELSLHCSIAKFDSRSLFNNLYKCLLTT